MEFYIWQGHRCVYDTVAVEFSEELQNAPALLLIHPIGVGLSRHFWDPFIKQWSQVAAPHAIYNLDLLGCGDSAMPQKPYTPQDWANQLAYFLEEVVSESVVLVVQGALLPVAVKLMDMPAAEKVEGIVLSGPPAWPLMTADKADWKTNLAWGLFASPLGNAFYRYARRESFLRSFSERQLFENAQDVSDRWLKMLDKGSRDMNSRYAVFSFLAGFWRQDYSSAIARIQQPVLVLMGEDATTIDRTVSKQVDSPDKNNKTTELKKKRLQDYLDHFPRAFGVSIAGRNVLPYESTVEFTQVLASFMTELLTEA